MNGRKFTTVAVSKEMMALIENVVRSSNGLYRTKSDFIHAALREKIERAHETNSPAHATRAHHDPAFK
ncbi:MAG: ribbon-helix-helix domain-containing protein [archaeon]